MAQLKWHIERHDDALTLSRGAARFDVSVSAVLMSEHAIGRARLAHQIRQDLWRALQHLRGFRPAVRVHQAAGRVEIALGGALPSPVHAAQKTQANARIETLLADPQRIKRWLDHARVAA